MVPLGTHSQALAVPKSRIVRTWQSLPRERSLLSPFPIIVTTDDYQTEVKISLFTPFIWFWNWPEQQVSCRGKLWAPLVCQSGRSFPVSPQRAEQDPKSNPFNESHRRQMGIWTFLISLDTLKLVCVEYKKQQHGERNSKPQQMNCFYAFPHVLSLFNIF